MIVFGFGIPLWLYILGPVWLGQSLISVRTFAEHQWSERPEGRTIIIERSPFALPVPQQQSAFRPSQEPDRRLVPAAEAVSRQARRVDRHEQGLCVPELSGAAAQLCLQGQGAGGASGAAPHARAGQGVPAARPGAQRQRLRHRPGAGRAAEGIGRPHLCFAADYPADSAHEPIHRRLAHVRLAGEPRRGRRAMGAAARPVAARRASTRRTRLCGAMPTCRPCRAASATAQGR